MKKLALYGIMGLLLMTSVLALTKIPTGPNGRYRPEFPFAYTTLFNEAYPDTYNPDPFGISLRSRYCDYGYIGASPFGTPVGDRCSSRYGRYGKYGKFGEFGSFNNEGIRTVDIPELGFDTERDRRRFDQGIRGRGTSGFYPTVQEIDDRPFKPRAQRTSRFYEDIGRSKEGRRPLSVSISLTMPSGDAYGY